MTSYLFQNQYLSGLKFLHEIGVLGFWGPPAPLISFFILSRAQKRFTAVGLVFER